MKYGKTALFLILFACACSKKEQPELSGESLRLEVSVDDAKTYLSGLKVLWNMEDKIVVNNNESMSTAVKEGGQVASFEVPATTAPLYMFYPSSAFVAGSVVPASSQYGSMIFPSRQAYVSGSFDPSAAFMTGYSESLTASVTLKHAVAYMKFTVAGSHPHAIRKIEMSSIGGEDMSGELTYNPVSGELEGESSSGLSTALVCADGMPQNQALFIAIPAKTYAQGIKIRIIDVKNHYQDIKSTKTFVAASGKIYPTSVTFAPTGTLVDADAEDVTKTLKITPYYKLNANGHSASSHASDIARSTLTPIGGSYQSLYKDAVGTDMPVFPSFVKSGDGYMMFYHKGFYYESSGKEEWAGFRGAWAKSPDGIDWTYKGELFPVRYDVPGHYDNTINVYYSGPFGVRLANGDILVVSAYRGNDDPRHKLLDNGLSVRISHDEGISWSAENLINVGMCWEPHALVLDAHSDHPGRVIVYYTDSCPYIEGVWTNAVISTGVSYIYSDDNGQSWKPDDALNDHLHAYRKFREEKSGYKVYSDQMPAVIQLCGRKQLVGCGESNYKPLGTTGAGTEYWIDVAYGKTDGTWGEPDEQGEMPDERTDKLCRGTGSSLCQFISGETVIGYSADGCFYMRRGDNDAKNWTDQTKVFNQSESYASKGFWGRMMCSNHIMIAGVGGAGGSKGAGYPMQVGQFYLNHSLSASQRAIKVDGDNDDWYNQDEALLLGSKGNMHGTARFCVNSGTLYILAEIENSSLTENDYFRIYISNPSSATVAPGDNFLQVKPNGNLSQKILSASSAWETAAMGAKAVIKKGKDFYFAEISVPLSSLPAADNSLLINLSAGDAVDGNQAMLPSGTSVSTANWPKLKL